MLACYYTLSVAKCSCILLGQGRTNLWAKMGYRTSSVQTPCPTANVFYTAKGTIGLLLHLIYLVKAGRSHKEGVWGRSPHEKGVLRRSSHEKRGVGGQLGLASIMYLEANFSGSRSNWCDFFWLIAKCHFSVRYIFLSTFVCTRTSRSRQL